MVKGKCDAGFPVRSYEMRRGIAGPTIYSLRAWNLSRSSACSFCCRRQAVRTDSGCSFLSSSNLLTIGAWGPLLDGGMRWAITGLMACLPPERRSGGRWVILQPRTRGAHSATRPRTLTGHSTSMWSSLQRRIQPSPGCDAIDCNPYASWSTILPVTAVASHHGGKAVTAGPFRPLRRSHRLFAQFAECARPTSRQTNPRVGASMPPGVAFSLLGSPRE